MKLPGAPLNVALSPPIHLYRAGALVTLLRLHWFINMRWVITLAGLAILAIERLLAPEAAARRPFGLILSVLLIGAVNLGWLLVSRLLLKRLQDTESVDDPNFRSARLFANAQVMTDFLLLTVILRYAGGVESPMAIFYVFHIAISALLLRTWQAVLQTSWALSLYTLLGLGELFGWITPHYDFLPSLPSSGQYADAKFVGIVIGVTVVSLFGVLYFTLRIANRLDDRERRLRTALSALQESRNALNDLQARRARFMLTAAHQLKSPLAAIHTMTTLIRDNYVQGEGIAKTCDSIIRRCQEGTTAVTELLTLARVQDADPHRHRTAIANVRGLVLEVCNRRAAQAEQKGLHFACELPDGVDLHAHVDQADLLDCVDNLVENAVKYTPAPGNVTVTVERHAWPGPGDGHAPPLPGAGPDDSIAISVTDTGIGIDPKELVVTDEESGSGTVFDPFRRGNTALAAGISGSGLGLSIVQTVVRQAGGSVSVESKPGEGSKFTITLPAQARG